MRALLLAVILLAAAPRALAAPDVPGALGALISTPLDVAGDAIGGVGLITAATVSSAGDLVSLLDRNRLTAPLTRGAVSGAIQHGAFGISWLSTRSLEILRHEDIERLPPPREAYVSPARFVGRLDVALDGVRALGLAARDAASGPLLGLLRGVGARERSEALDRWRREARIRALGPEPLARQVAGR